MLVITEVVEKSTFIRGTWINWLPHYIFSKQNTAGRYNIHKCKVVYTCCVWIQNLLLNFVPKKYLVQSVLMIPFFFKFLFVLQLFYVLEPNIYHSII